MSREPAKGCSRTRWAENVRPPESGRRAACHPVSGHPRPIVERQEMADAEKVAPRCLQSAGEKIDISGRPENRSRPSVKGKKTPENLVRKTVSDFFTSIGRLAPYNLARRWPRVRLSCKRHNSAPSGLMLQSANARFQTGRGHSRLTKVVVDNVRTRVTAIEVGRVEIVS